MTSTETEPYVNGRPLTREELLKQKEQGTAFDWVEWPTNVALDGMIATEYPDRSWAHAIEEMLKSDGQAEAVLTALTMPIRMANWSIEKPDEDTGQTAWVRDVLTRHRVDGGMSTTMDQVIGQMTQARAFKRSYHELVWTRGEDGKAVYSKIAWRPPASCHLMRHRLNGQILGFKQWQDPENAPDFTLDKEGYVEIPAQRAVVYVHGTHRDPLYGKSDLDVVMWAYNLKQQVLKWWARYCDRLGLPKVVAYGKDPTSARQNAAAIAKLGAAGVAAVSRNNPDEKPFDVLDTSGSGAAWSAFKALVDYLDGMMSRSVLASWLDLASAASNGAGSYALSADQSGIFMQTIFATAQEIADLITCEILAPLVRVNFGPKAKVPRFVFEKIDTEQTDKILNLVDTVLAAQNGPQLPQGIFHLLLAKVAQFVNLDDAKVEKILESEPDQPTYPDQAATVGPDGQPIVPAGPGGTETGGQAPAPVDSTGPAPDSPEALAQQLQGALG